MRSWATKSLALSPRNEASSRIRDRVQRLAEGLFRGTAQDLLGSEVPLSFCDDLEKRAVVGLLGLGVSVRSTLGLGSVVDTAIGSKREWLQF